MEISASSISANMADLKGRYFKKEVIKFLYIARGSLFETVTVLTIFLKKKWIAEKVFQDLETKAVEIGKMLSGLIISVGKSMV